MFSKKENKTVENKMEKNECEAPNFLFLNIERKNGGKFFYQSKSRADYSFVKFLIIKNKIKG